MIQQRDFLKICGAVVSKPIENLLQSEVHVTYFFGKPKNCEFCANQVFCFKKPRKTLNIGGENLNYSYAFWDVVQLQKFSILGFNQILATSSLATASRNKFSTEIFFYNKKKSSYIHSSFLHRNWIGIENGNFLLIFYVNYFKIFSFEWGK